MILDRGRSDILYLQLFFKFYILPMIYFKRKVTKFLEIIILLHTAIILSKPTVIGTTFPQKKPYSWQIPLQLRPLTFSGFDSSSFSSSEEGPAKVDTLLITPSLASWSKKISPPLSTKSLMICKASKWPSSSSWGEKKGN